MLSCLIYISSRPTQSTEAEIEQILKVAQIKNQKCEITGLLLYSDKHFIQYLEGEADQLLALYAKIKQDDRHFGAVLLASKPITRRLFPSWQMGAKKFINEQISFLTAPTPAEEEIFESVLTGKADENIVSLFERFAQDLT